MTTSEHQQNKRLINPLGMRVLVRLLPADDRSKGGLYLPSTVQASATDALYGEVLSVARAAPVESNDLEGPNVSGIPDGARILFAPEAGFRIPWDEHLRLVETKDVLAVVEEFTHEEAN